jgi:hypothetical protein
MNSPQNRYDLLVAAQNTAVKNLTATNERNLVRDIGTDFDELKIDDSFFEDFNRQVRDWISTYNHLKSQKLIVSAAPAIPAVAKA